MVTPTPETPPAPAAAGAAGTTGWQRWRGPLLFASVCLNLFLIGLMVGGAVPPRHRPHWFDHRPMAGGPGPREFAGPGQREPGRPGGPALAFRHAVQSLSEGDRRVFEDAMETARPDVQRMQRELRQARQRVNELARAEPFDKAATMGALDEVRQRQQAIQQRLHAGTVEALAKLPADSRRQFADALGARLRP